MIAQTSDCVMVVMAESECLLGVHPALLHSCPLSPPLSGSIQSVVVFTCTSEPAWWKTTLWVSSVKSQHVVPCLAVLHCTHTKRRRSAYWPCSFVPVTVRLCVCSLHACRDRSNKLTDSASRTLQNRSGFKFYIELRNNKGISLQKFTPVKVNFSLIFKLWYF